VIAQSLRRLDVGLIAGDANLESPVSGQHVLPQSSCAFSPEVWRPYAHPIRVIMAK
jgi:hypothetical protein